MICALLLAAGRSRRMGTQKLLLPFGQSTVVGHIVDELLQSPVDQVLVVTGANGEAISTALAGRSVRLISNPKPDSEMLSSVRCGLAALPEKCEAVLLALGDHPGVQRQLVGQLVHHWRLQGHGIIVPFHEGHRGHPFLFSSRYRDEIQQRYDDAGMRGFLDAHSDELFRLEVDDASILEDIDYPEDYRRAIRELDEKIG